MREGKRWGVNRNVFDAGRQMLRRSCLFCVKAHLSWQVSSPRWLFVPNPALMSRERQQRKGRDSGRGNEEGQKFGRGGGVAR